MSFFTSSMITLSMILALMNMSLLLVRAESASGCCAAFYGASSCVGQTCDCASCAALGDSYSCRDSIGATVQNGVMSLNVATDGSKDCVSYTIDEAGCPSDKTWIAASAYSGMGCPQCIEDINGGSCGSSSSTTTTTTTSGASSFLVSMTITPTVAYLLLSLALV